MMVRDFQRIVGIEAKEQFFDMTGELPDNLVTCVGGRSNAKCSHALAYALKLAKGKPKQSILVNLSGRGDKDIDLLRKILDYLNKRVRDVILNLFLHLSSFKV